jgi:predicted transcriptional regulator
LLQQRSDQELKAKITLLHLIDQFSVPLTNQQLTDFIMEQELMNYFDLQQYLTDLVETSMLEYSTSEGDDYYIITESGRGTLSLFSDRVSQTLRRKINDSIDTKKKSFVIKTNVSAEYYKEDDNDYVVQLTVKEGIYTLMDIKVNVVTTEHAKQICENWEKKAQYLYADILNKLIDDTE